MDAPEPAACRRAGSNPAARVYESLGSDCFLAVVPGWLNLGLWNGPGSDEAEQACRRLVETRGGGATRRERDR
jgi:hypothetical protein